MQIQLHCDKYCLSLLYDLTVANFIYAHNSKYD
jgi:hypothetical protein